jgi:DNA polymerase/3'-5' exonuclease PolX
MGYNKEKIPYSKIKIFADAAVAKLLPYCARIEIAGSIRREKQLVGDIEIVCTPLSNCDLFGNPISHVQGFLDTINTAVWRNNNNCIGHEPIGKYYRRQIPGDIQVDIFCCTPTNWGWIYLLRTGSADFNQKILDALKDNGIQSINGYLQKGASLLATPEEEDVFDLVGWDFVPPAMRV